METPKKAELEGHALCISCGLCCTGHLFTWAILENNEIVKSRSLGLKIIHRKNGEKGFRLPCPLWNEKCTVYLNDFIPSVCGKFRCSLLKELHSRKVTLHKAKARVEKARDMIKELESKLPQVKNGSFRFRLLKYTKRLEKLDRTRDDDITFRLKAGALFVYLEIYFGATKLFDLTGMAGEPSQNATTSSEAIRFQEEKEG